MEIVKLRESINQIRRPSTFRDFEALIDAAKKVDVGRSLDWWSPEEIAWIQQYLEGAITRQELNGVIHRSLPSLNNQISRVRKKTGV
jgi:hypothetical protein